VMDLDRTIKRVQTMAVFCALVSFFWIAILTATTIYNYRTRATSQAVQQQQDIIDEMAQQIVELHDRVYDQECVP